MKIAFPTQKEEGLDSRVFGHFGSAPHFIIVDTETDTFKSAGNPNMVHAPGQCQPLKALSGETIDAVVVGGIGAGALTKLNAAGIQVFRAIEGTITENLALIKSNKLPLFTVSQTCAGHGKGGNCAH